MSTEGAEGETRIRLALLERDQQQAAHRFDKLDDAMKIIGDAMARFAAAEERGVEDREAIKALGRRVADIETKMPGLVELRKYAVSGVIGVFVLVFLLLLGSAGIGKWSGPQYQAIAPKEVGNANP